ncbi:MAG TPA: class I SAM-dependent methyltransferase [Longimicrobium sp.]|nr:class I SAM-dependent methyltransferase [Longimicrobium sp.]
MRESEALTLLRAAVPAADGETWADLGAGTGTFTRALAALVGASGRVIAVDADDGALAALRSWPARSAAPVTLLRGDFTRPLDLPPLDGVVMANALHFIADAAAVLSRVAFHLKPGGRLVVIEYEGRRPSRWVPYPVSIARLGELAVTAGFTAPTIAATRPSAFGGRMYVAAISRSG